MLKRYIDYVALIPSKESAAKLIGYIKKHPHIFLNPDRNLHSTVRYPGVNPLLELDSGLEHQLFNFPSVTLDPSSYKMGILGESLVLAYESPQVLSLHNSLNNSNSEMEEYLRKIGFGINSPYNFSNFVPHITLSQPPFGDWKSLKDKDKFKEPIILEGILI